MEKAYDITKVGFENGYLVVVVDGLLIRLRLSEVSERLAKASETELQNFRVSPSGYGIHWNSLDEDISINGLLTLYRGKQSLQHQV